MFTLQEEINRRRTFAIISHPDAGKTTLTEKFLLYGGAIQSAGAVKGKASDRHAVSDWMELEKQRGISITSSVMQFEYDGYCINILDTPGHQDFSEDTYRTLMAADSAVMVIDAAKGIEPQTRKLFKVCAMRDIPIFTFINKLDREARDPFDLLDELEKEFGIGTYPMNWPIGCGVNFHGVYDRERQEILAFADAHRGRSRIEGTRAALTDTETLDSLIGEYRRRELVEQVELLDAASFDFDLDKIRHGKLSPVFFGSALNNFGVEPFLKSFLEMTTPPLSRETAEGTVDPVADPFSAFVFKIQANMNKAHRDRIAFMRISSGVFDRNEEYY
ncbi:MAG: peptide chain release factor 3, partial [Clostridia bacterium]|nr:peptide chain release factor 3 [Clostridia bacterium]